MSENKSIVRSGVVFFVAASVLFLLLLFIVPALPASWTRHINVDVVLLVIACVALISTVLGFLAFKTSRGKVASFGGLIIFLASILLFATTAAEKTRQPAAGPHDSPAAGSQSGQP